MREASNLTQLASFSIFVCVYRNAINDKTIYQYIQYYKDNFVLKKVYFLTMSVKMFTNKSGKYWS